MEYSRSFIVTPNASLVSWTDYSSLPSAMRRHENHLNGSEFTSLSNYRPEKHKKMAIIIDKTTSKKISMERYNIKPSSVKKCTSNSVSLNDFLQPPSYDSSHPSKNKNNSGTLAAMRNRSFSLKSWQVC